MFGRVLFNRFDLNFGRDIVLRDKRGVQYVCPVLNVGVLLNITVLVALGALGYRCYGFLGSNGNIKVSNLYHRVYLIGHLDFQSTYNLPELMGHHRWGHHFTEGGLHASPGMLDLYNNPSLIPKSIILIGGVIDYHLSSDTIIEVIDRLDQ